MMQCKTTHIMSDAIKFPKTPRLAAVMAEDIHRAWRTHGAVVEEKLDGANIGVWFEREELRLQSRGHVLSGGASERQFAPLHGWTAERLDALRRELGEQRVLYGEWCFAKHRAFYDALPDWLLGLDVLDRATGFFLGTRERGSIFRACGVTAVAALWSGTFGKMPASSTLLGQSRYKTPRWREALTRQASKAGVRDPMTDTDDSDKMEGIYVRVELGGRVVGRMKLHRAGFEKVRSDSWRERPLVRNVLRSETIE